MTHLLVDDAILCGGDNAVMIEAEPEIWKAANYAHDPTYITCPECLQEWKAREVEKALTTMHQVDLTGAPGSSVPTGAGYADSEGRLYLGEGGIFGPDGKLTIKVEPA